MHTSVITDMASAQIHHPLYLLKGKIWVLLYYKYNMCFVKAQEHVQTGKQSENTYFHPSFKFVNLIKVEEKIRAYKTISNASDIFY